MSSNPGAPVAPDLPARHPIQAGNGGAPTSPAGRRHLALNGEVFGGYDNVQMTQAALFVMPSRFVVELNAFIDRIHRIDGNAPVRATRHLRVVA